MCCPIWTFDPEYAEIYVEAIKIAINMGMEKIWNLIYGLTTEQRNKATGTLVESNSMLHIAAYPLVDVPDEALQKKGEQQLSKIFSKPPGAAVKVQREIQWYKEVERMVPSSYKILANKNGNTLPELFTKSHAELVKQGEQWTRDTATSCTIVATLIVTVMFAAAFTLSGGAVDKPDESRKTPLQSGDPKFLHHDNFMVFIISDAFALFSSFTAVLMFLSILTSRFEEKDFFKALPKRLIIGLATHFLSIATMMVAFGATLDIVLDRWTSWAYFLIMSLVCVPATLFALLHFPLFIDMVSSTYGGGIFKRKTKCSFFDNPNDYVTQEYPPSGGGTL
ncbi:ankyrin repeat-containing protein At5g02620-like [Cornus florida]|uniref:ankyrin repeat-containing protein At5g02620-like n=1 Tax=Cornus florida TaxID=4283 RepID=UPI002898F1E0|nr:ankyrin repeat-containing protein At5g02620-like [Cornus florida]